MTHTAVLSVENYIESRIGIVASRKWKRMIPSSPT